MAEETTYWDNEHPIDEIKTGEHTVIRVLVAQKKGKSYLVYREWYNTKKNPTFYPSKHGGAIPIECAEGFVSGLIHGVHYARDKGLI